jgi:hypothetical protein
MVVSEPKNNEAGEGRPTLSYDWIKRDLLDLITASENCIDRDRRSALLALHPGGPTVLLSIVRLARETWKTICYICADKVVEHGGRVEFAVSVPPLTRTLADYIFTVIYIFDQPAERLADFYKANWAKLHEEHSRLQQRYGSDPEWADWLAAHGAEVEGWKRDGQVTTREERNPNALSRRWPNPGGMRRNTSDSVRSDFLGFLNEWYYAGLSQDSHMSGPGMLRRGGMLVDGQPKEAQLKYRSDCVLASLTLLLVLLSELAVDACESDTLKRRAAYLWGMLLPFWGSAQELWDDRYNLLLSSPAA